MSQLQYNEIREKKIIIYNNEPCEVVESHVARTQQRKPQNQVKLRSLIAGKTIAATFHVSESADEADIVKRDIIFLYQNKGEYWFCDPEDKSKRFKLEFKVKEAPPAVRGDTSKGGNKIIVLENGANLNAPMFINEGDTIRVNTETGEYVERV